MQSATKVGVPVRRWRSGRRVRRDVVRGLVGGLLMATYYTALTILIVALRGTAPYDALGVSVGRALAAYWLGGVAGAAAWGLFLPLASTRLGAVVLGIIAAFPASLAIEMAGGTGEAIDWPTVAFLTVTFGSVCGFVLSSLGGPSWKEIGDLEDRVDQLLEGDTDSASQRRDRKLVPNKTQERD